MRGVPLSASAQPRRGAWNTDGAGQGVPSGAGEGGRERDPTPALTRTGKVTLAGDSRSRGIGVPPITPGRGGWKESATPSVAP